MQLVCIRLAITIGLAASAFARQAQLDSVSNVRANAGQPRLVLGGDFDGDGRDDVLVAGSPTLALLRSQGQRAFVSTPLGNVVGAIALMGGRFNADSQRDFAWLASNGSLSVRLGVGGGGFGAPTTVATIPSATSLAASDLNRDGKLDLIVTASTPPSVKLLTGDGLGGFSLSSSVACGPNPLFPRVAQLNSDLYRDVLVANVGTPDVSVYLVGPNGLFPPSVYGMPAAVIGFDVGDMNADGSVDLVACGADRLWIAFGNSAGTFSVPAIYPLPGLPARLEVDDFTGDGLPDVLIERVNAGRLDVLENRGAAGFLLGASIPLPTDIGEWTLGDFDVDGFVDVALAQHNTMGHVWVAWGPLQSIHETTRIAAPNLFPSLVRVADLDGDGDADLVTNGASQGIVLHRGTPVGWSAPQIIQGHNSVDALEVLDLDGDGRLDVIAANSFDGFADVFLGQPSGTLSHLGAQRAGASPSALALGDFNGDGIVDCAAANSHHNNITLRMGVGGGLFAPMVASSQILAPYDLEAADLDGDGDLDLAVSTFSSMSPGLVAFVNDGAGNFTAGGVLDSQISHQVKSADLDADGDVDFVLCSVAFNSGLVLLNNGLGQFTPQSIPLTGAYPRSIAAGDLDGDGDLDLAFGNALDHTLSLVEQYAPAQWRQVGSEPLGRNPMDLALGDLDGAGPVDLVSANFYGVDLTVLAGAHARFGELEPYCTAKVNSVGCLPQLEIVGVPSASSPMPCTIAASNELNQAPGMLFYGYSAAATPFGGGFLCIEAPWRRTPLQSSGGAASGADCSGSYSFDWNALVRSGVDPALAPGATAFVQYWSRDGGSPDPFNLTSAARVVIAP